jgi:hypothetical protein
MRLAGVDNESALQIHLGCIDPDSSNVRTSYSLAITMTNFVNPSGFSFYLDPTDGVCVQQLLINVPIRS